MDKLVNVEINRNVENPVIRQNVIQKPVYIDKIVTRNVPRDIEKIVEVRVDQIVEVPVDVVVEVPIFKEKHVYKDVYVNKNTRKSNTHVQQEAQDYVLTGKIESQRKQISEIKTRIARMKGEFQSVSRKHVDLTLHSDIDYTSQNVVLNQKIRELEQAIQDVAHGKIRKSLLR